MNFTPHKFAEYFSDALKETLGFLIFHHKNTPQRTLYKLIRSIFSSHPQIFQVLTGPIFLHSFPLQVDTGAVVQQLPAGGTSLYFSRKQNTLWMGSYEANEVLVWNLETGTEDCKLPFGKPTDDQNGKIKWIESIGNDKVVVGAESGIVVIFDEENQVIY